jgi:hypothetical protein
VAAYYRKEAAASGWHLTEDGTKKMNKRVKSTEKWPSDTCYSKDLDSFTADLQLIFDYWSLDAERNPSAKTYWLEISFSPEGGNCHI